MESLCLLAHGLHVTYSTISRGTVAFSIREHTGPGNCLVKEVPSHMELPKRPGMCSGQTVDQVRVKGKSKHDLSVRPAVDSSAVKT
ncbi:unnamed protein product [Parascedosporium putredinis]|uniref:Uncharacterized protein n=1 Tax=Parascedosporium putredinis TaxID=1442378 RepID=A0A9P1H301_9PEZI|nr:unnamed protein product [Parascedosporium putredinis]CAI7996474.1 unnamed protein product [Parascedosporium putredinis]